MKLLISYFRQALQSFINKPSSILLAQLPIGFVILFQRTADPYFENKPWVALLILLPLFSICSSFCLALTFTVIDNSNSQRPQTLRAACLKVVAQSKNLLLSSCLLSVFLGLGLAALVLPGLYFMTLYLFVPLLVITEPGLATSTYLYRSKLMVKKSPEVFTTTLILVIVTLIIEFGSTYLVEYLSKKVGGAAVIDLILSLTFSAFLNGIVVSHFLNLRVKGNP